MKIQLKKTIQNILSQPLKECGFEYKGARTDLWIFSRTRNTITQCIEIQRSNHFENSMNMNFTAVNEKGHTLFGFWEARKLLNEEEQSRLYYNWWLYRTQDELEAVLHEFLEILFHKGGMEWFEYASHPVPAIPDLVAQKLMERCRQPLVDNQVSLEEMEQQILAERQSSNSLDWEKLLEWATDLGAFVQSDMGGEWSWDERTQQPVLEKIGGKDTSLCSLRPLMSILHFWCNPFYTLVSRYQSFKEFTRNR